MNWYKIAQRQGLLFYPWNKLPYQVVQPIGPTYVGQDGQNHYDCTVCKKDTPQDNVAEWIKSDDKRKYYYGIEYKKKQILEIIKKIKEIVLPYYQQYAVVEKQQKQEWAKGNYDFDKKYEFKTIVPDLFQYIGSIPNRSQLCEFVKSTFMNWSSSFVLSMLCDPKSELTYSDFDRFSNEMKNTKELTSTLTRDFDSNKNFGISLSKPVCNECYDEMDECTFCDKKILPGENVLRDEDDNIACQECMERGVSPCSSCWILLGEDEQRYNEGDGETYCESCYENISRDYSEFEDIVERHAKKNPYPFKEWFGGNNRIYLPYIQQNKLGENDKNIISMLKKEEFEVDHLLYLFGYYKKGKNQYRIGKVIQLLLKNGIKRIHLNNPQADPKALSTIISNFRSTMENILKQFNESEFRKIKNTSDLEVVISQDVHDVAKMSTGRSWTSCMALGRGSHHQDVYCEVESGALIAYLIRRNDKDIETPLARLLIRRYSSDEGKSIALPESRMYGSGTNDFYKTVKNWLDSKQESAPKGQYERIGGNWKDELPQTYIKAIKEIREMLKLARSRKEIR